MKKILSLLALSALLAVSCQTKTNENACEEPIRPVGIVTGISDEDLLELVQKQTFRYFWDFGHPVSGMARERSNTVKGATYWDYINEVWGEPNFSEHTFGPEFIAVGGSGFGIMAMTVAVERGWISREAALRRLHQILEFLLQADTFHGAFPHFLDGETGKAIAFGLQDDGADIVETSYLMMGLLTAREYFNGDNPFEAYLRAKITQLWETVNWAWFEKDGKLFWHWSPYQGFDMDFPIRGWNECLITYIMAASSPVHPISKDVYESCWKGGTGYRNTREHYGITSPLGDWGESLCGPLFFEQYTFQGIDPNGLVDEDGVNYFEQGRAHTLLHRAYAIANPKGHKGYGEKCWGFTAGDSNQGYVAHDPGTDFGVIQPTAALSSFPYTPEESMEVLKHFYYDLGDTVWGEYGFVDGFNPETGWASNTWIAIDEGPIVNMIENYRTGMLWKLFMNIPDIQRGLSRLGFSSPYIP